MRTHVSGSVQNVSSSAVRPSTSSALYPVIRRKLSLTSMKRPSVSVLTIMESGLERNALANFSSEERSASSARCRSSAVARTAAMV